MTSVSSPDRVRHFYDNFANKLIADYWQGNPRAAAAIQHSLCWIRKDAKCVLDIGCGIGWSTREIARHCQQAKVVGWDISPGLVDVAQALTHEPNVRFEVGDFCQERHQTVGRFDAIVLLDVYEHFPAAHRAEVHAALNDLLCDNGVVILSYPTPKHQAFLRTEHPEGLQPVDEDVTRDDVAKLAEDLAARIEYFREVTIWNADDYAHATVCRGHPNISRGRRTANLERVSRRRARVRARLDVRVLSGGLVVPTRTGPAVCIVSPSLSAISETFIRNHVTRLPLPVHVLHGSRLTLDDDGRNIGPLKVVQGLQIVSRRLGGSGFPQFSTRAIAHYLRRNRISAVLAEYGTNGVRLTKACSRLGIPLIVHFHGHDAYVNEVLKTNQQQYCELFEQAAAIIAVSRDMEEQLAKLGAPSEKIAYIPCGVDTELFGNVTPSKSAEHFVAVGRFVEKKSPHLTLLAFSKVLAACPNARLIMIGDGPLLNLCKQLAAAVGVAEAVEFTGFRDQAFVAETMQKSRAFVQHSVRALNGDSEGTPVGVIEAQATGLPVVATAHAGIKDVVVDGETGFLVEELDVDAMAEAMIAVIRDPTLADRLGKAGRERVIANFSLSQSIQKLAQVIEDAVNT